MQDDSHAFMRLPKTAQPTFQNNTRAVLYKKTQTLDSTNQMLGFEARVDRLGLIKGTFNVRTLIMMEPVSTPV